jgi:uncharacterized membrane protein YidH (DUF202 family)
MSDSQRTSGDRHADTAQARSNQGSFRTELALDGTTLAWIRTCLTMASFGFGMVAFFRTLREKYPTPENLRLHQFAIQFGIGLIVVGTAAMALVALSHWFTLRRLRRGDPLELTQWPMAIGLALLLAIAFLAGLWALLER